MAVSVASVPGSVTFTLTVINQATLINLPNHCRKVRLLFGTNDGKVAFIGDDGDPIDAGYMLVDADVKDELFVDQDPFEQGAGPAAVLVAAAVVPTVVRVLATAG